MLLATIFVPSLLPDDEAATSSTYTEFRDKVVAGERQSVEVNRTSGKISGELDNGDKFFTNGGTDRGLSEADEALLEEQGVTVEFKSPSSNWLLNVLGLMLPVILIIGFFVWMQRRAAGQMGNVMSIGRSRAKAYNTDKPSTTFADIAGYTGRQAGDHRGRRLPADAGAVP